MLDGCFYMYVSGLCNIFVVQVVSYWAETGISGFTVYKFRLKRLEGQPSLTTAQVFCFSMCYKTVCSFY